jgi:hypothetical protein
MQTGLRASGVSYIALRGERKRWEVRKCCLETSMMHLLYGFSDGASSVSALFEVDSACFSQSSEAVRRGRWVCSSVPVFQKGTAMMRWTLPGVSPKRV